MNPLALPQAAMLAVVGPNGPVLEPVSLPDPVPVVAAYEPERSCVKRWRLIHAATQAADIASTVYIVESGKGTEANPIIRGLFGKRPKVHELVAFKAVQFGILEWRASKASPQGACTMHKIGAVITGATVGLNLRIALK